MRRGPAGWVFGAVPLGAVALVVVLLLTGGNRGGAGVPAPHDGPRTPKPAPTAIRQVLPELVRFVEETRGLTFKRPPQILLLDEEAFLRRLLIVRRMTMVEARRRQRLFQALGLVPRGVDLSKAQRMLDAATTVGLYDQETKRLFVRGVEPTPYVRMVIVHELTHAAQDQHFNLSRRRPQSVDSAQGFTAVVEGDANRIEGLYFDSLTPAEQVEALAEEAGLSAAAPSDVPRALREYQGFPYTVGADFASTVVDLSGQAGLDAAFRTPPATAEQVLHPDLFLTKEDVRRPPPPRADRRAAQVGSLGEFGLQVLLRETVPQARLDAATSGWGGDRYVTWVNGPVDCVRMHIVMDTRADADELAEALKLWAASSGATVEGRDPIVLTSCH